MRALERHSRLIHESPRDVAKKAPTSQLNSRCSMV